MPTPIEPRTDGKGRRIAIVAARFTQAITQILLDDAVLALRTQGVDENDITIAWVPGSFELPLTCEIFASSGSVDGVIALGCVIRGETSHYDYVCESAAKGILETGLRHRIPVIFGVLTTEDRAQALARADGTKSSKGAECADAVLTMIGTVEAIRTR
jgi:6,7-dimethyl-8-ribityllumazine synthase